MIIYHLAFLNYIVNYTITPPFTDMHLFFVLVLALTFLNLFIPLSLY